MALDKRALGKRALGVQLPTFATDRVRRRLGEKLGEAAKRIVCLLVSTDAYGRRTITGRDARAAAAGVRTEMTLAHARALLADVEQLSVGEHAPEQDEVALRRLAAWAHRFAPIVAVDPPDGLLLDVSGCGRLFGGERRLLERLATNLDTLGFRDVHLAVAPTFTSARALARFGASRRLAIGTEHLREMLDPRPPIALGLDAATEEALLEVGIERIGELRRLPRSTIPARFGDETLLRLDQALGEATEWIEPIRPSPPPRAERIFEGPTRRVEALQIAMREVLEELAEELERREAGVERLVLTLGRADLDPLPIELGLSRPSRDPRHLEALLRPRLDGAHLGYGVESVTLDAPRVRRIPAGTPSAWSDEEMPLETSDREWGELLDALVARLGPDRVTRVAPVETHHPDRAFRRALPTAAVPRSVAAIARAARPSRLLRTPRELTGEPESGFTTMIGPERIASEWWRSDAPGDDTAPGGRDYYRGQRPDGRWLWVARDLKTGRWFIHGEWA